MSEEEINQVEATGAEVVEVTPVESDDVVVNIEETEEVYEDENYDDVAE